MPNFKVSQRTGNVTYQAEAESIKDIFKQLSMLSEIFVQECGCCHNDEVVFKVRVVEDNEYYECVCTNPKCRAKLSYGQHKKGGTLFPKVAEGKGENRKWLEDGGWSRKYSSGKPADHDED
jgi:hypothetical protein